MRILCLSSCRVGVPLRKVTPVPNDVIYLAAPLVFSHTAPEAAQQVRMLRGEVVPPPELLPWLWDLHRPRPIATAAEVAVVEVCARRLYRHASGWLIAHRTYTRLSVPDVTIEEMTDGQILDSVLDLIAYLAPMPVLVVPHFDCDFPGVGRLEARASIRNALATVPHLFDPAPVIERYGGPAACLKGDTAHYADAFIPTIGRALYARLEEVARGQ